MAKDLCFVCRGVFVRKGRREPAPNSNFDSVGQTFYIHHKTSTGLKKAIEKGCQLCAALWRSLTKQDRASIVQSHDPLSTGAFIVSYNLTAYRPYSIEFRLQISTNNCIERSFGLRPIQGSPVVKSVGTRIPTNTGSEEVSGLAIKWISGCIQNHEKCKVTEFSNGEPQLPTRLLWVGLPGDLSIRLCHTRLFPKDTLYTTLSHCWGTGKFLNLTTHNLAELEGGVPLVDLPKTFQDAIIFTRRTPVRYIWIDSMCIIQNSPEDWEVEALRMEQVYSNAYCNIAATAGSDSQAGCFVEREVEICIPMIFHVPSMKGPLSAFYHGFLQSIRSAFSTTYLNLIEPGAYVCEERNLWKREITDSALGRRAWVFQERLLARRVLHFASTQIFFECCSFQAAEISPSGMALPSYHGTKLKSDFADALENFRESPEQRALNTWKTIVEQFTACELTYETDRLRAIAGLARRLKNTLKCRYNAGLWDHELVSQLVWRSSGISNRASTYQAPTWSWASRPGQVVFDSSISRSSYLWEQFVAIQGIEVRTTDGDEMSHVMHGSLRLRGLLLPSSIKFEKEGTLAKGKDLEILVRQYSSNFTPDISDDLAETYLDGRFWSIPCFFGNIGLLFGMQGLVLKSSGKKGQYRRVGAFTCVGRHGLQFGKHIKKALVIRGDAAEKALITEDLYEDYDEENDRYTFTVV